MPLSSPTIVSAGKTGQDVPLSSPTVVSGIHLAQSLVFCGKLFCFCPFFCASLLFVPRYTATVYIFVIFKPFLRLSSKIFFFLYFKFALQIIKLL